jgi:hypothetical protein
MAGRTCFALDCATMRRQSPSPIAFVDPLPLSRGASACSPQRARAEASSCPSPPMVRQVPGVIEVVQCPVICYGLPVSHEVINELTAAER